MKYIRTYEKFEVESLESIEQKLRTITDKEWIFVFKDGKQIYSQPGAAGDVDIDDPEITKQFYGATATHNHPEKYYERFSKKDIRNAINWGLKELRMVTRKHTYSISAPTGVIRDYISWLDIIDDVKISERVPDDVQIELMNKGALLTFESEEEAEYQKVVLESFGLVYQIL